MVMHGLYVMARKDHYNISHLFTIYIMLITVLKYSYTTTLTIILIIISASIHL